MTKRTPRMGDQEQGSVAVWMISTALAMILMVGLAVDGSGQVLAKQRVCVLKAPEARRGHAGAGRGLLEHPHGRDHVHGSTTRCVDSFKTI